MQILWTFRKVRFQTGYIQMHGFILFILILSCTQCTPIQDTTATERKEKICSLNGLISFWDFEHTQNDAWSSYAGRDTFPVYLRQIGDENNYTLESWPYQDPSSSIQYDKGGPFGHAIRFHKGHIYGAIPRRSFTGTQLDIHGQQPFTLLAWIKFYGKRHLIAGIWDEGGWHKYAGRRQFALFAGLFNQLGVIGHISTTGAASYPQSEIPGSQYARIRAIDAAPFKDGEWVATAMSYDPSKKEVRAYLNGKMSTYFLTDPVAQDVFQFDTIKQANPLTFAGPIAGERVFTLKFNGYQFEQGGIAEHRVQVDLDGMLLTYQTESKPGVDLIGYQVIFDIRNRDDHLLQQPIVLDHDKMESAIDLSRPLTHQDTIFTKLLQKQNGQWVQVGSEIRKPIEEGAPFTFGRALGLASEEIDHGSELYIDGVAIFNRVLREAELSAISFMTQ